jgi:hypothetical protein
MTVYVDELRTHAQSPACLLGVSCHLTADSPEELHAFARRLGLERWWCHEHRGRPHYDVSEKRRARALQLGAVEITARERVRELLLRGRDGALEVDQRMGRVCGRRGFP